MLAGETVIPTLTGLQFLVDLLESPSRVFVWNGTKVTIGVVHVEPAGQSAPVCLTLDDSTDLIISPEMQVFLIGGSLAPAREIPVGTSILPFYFREDRQRHRLYREPGEWHLGAHTNVDSGRWRRIYRMVAEVKLGRRCRPDDAVRLIDGDRNNCSPENIVVEERRITAPSTRKNFTSPLVEAQKIIDRPNHRVTAVKTLPSREMYSIVGEGSGSLAAGGVFIRADRVK